MPNSILPILTSATLGQALLSLSLLLSRPRRRPSDAPLVMALAAAAVALAIDLSAAVSGLDPGILFSLSLAAKLSIAPALALYVEALTAENEWRVTQRHLRRFLPAAVSLTALPMILALSPDDRRTMMGEGRTVEAVYPLFVAVWLFALIMVGTVAAAWHAGSSLRRLGAYRQRLEALFANNDRRELRWLSILLLILIGVWAFAIVALAADGLFDAPPPRAVAELMGLAGVWVLGFLGLGQAPGFEGRQMQAEEVETGGKYRKSPLAPDQAERIAARIEAIMRDERLYLDPTLSLPKLSARLKLSPNLVSQTLNERMRRSFFAYVNRKRAEAAATMMATDDRTMLEVALEVGFNSKSAFYKAFREAFSISPARYARTIRSKGVDLG